MDTVNGCISLVDDDRRCPEMATFLVRGSKGHLWSGRHCDEHTLSVVRSMRHQGGCEIVPLGDGSEVSS